jgi:hypothetical protein
MNPAAQQLEWQWPAGRMAASTLTVRVTKIKKQGKGLFGIRENPSLIENLPDAHIIEGTVEKGGEMGLRIVITVPFFEMPQGLRPGDELQMELLNSSTCIGLWVRG